MAHMYEVGTRAWQPDTTEGWVASEVEEKVVNGDKVKLVFRLDNGEVYSSVHFQPSVRWAAVLIHLTVTGEDHRDHSRHS